MLHGLCALLRPMRSDVDAVASLDDQLFLRRAIRAGCLASLVLACVVLRASAFGAGSPAVTSVQSIPPLVVPPSPSAALHAEALATAWVAESRSSPPTGAACKSGLFGDTQTTACGGFCKQLKAANHCKFCKCKECTFCRDDASGDTQRASLAASTPLTPTVASLPEGTPFAAAVTSVYLPHLLSIRAAGYPVNLFSRERLTYVPQDDSSRSYSRLEPLVTRAYYDGAGTPPRLPAVEWLDLDVVQPWAKAFVREQRRANSSVQRAYRRRRYTCVAPATDLSTCADVFTVYKVAAIVDAIHALAARHLLWIDLDAFLQRPLDGDFWRWVTRFAVVTIGARTPHNPETGACVRHDT